MFGPGAGSVLDALCYNEGNIEQSRQALSMKILIVDDEQNIREQLSKRLRREGFTVFTGANGLEGLRQFHMERPDLVVLDIVMPEMDGLTVCQRIREVAETPIMMLSANAITEEDVVRGLTAGAMNTLRNPWAWMRSWRACARCCAARRWSALKTRRATPTVT